MIWNIGCRCGRCVHADAQRLPHEIPAALISVSYSPYALYGLAVWLQLTRGLFKWANHVEKIHLNLSPFLKKKNIYIYFPLKLSSLMSNRKRPQSKFPSAEVPVCNEPLVAHPSLAWCLERKIPVGRRPFSQAGRKRSGFSGYHEQSPPPYPPQGPNRPRPRTHLHQSHQSGNVTLMTEKTSRSKKNKKK